MKLFKFIFKTIKPLSTHLGMGLSAIGIGAALKVLDPLVGIAIIDFAFQTGDMTLFLLLIAVMVTFVIISFAFENLGNFFIQVCRMKLQESLAIKDTQYFLEKSKNSKTQNNNSDHSNVISAILTTDLSNFVYAAVQFITIAIILTLIDPVVGILTLMCAVILTWTSNHFSKKLGILNQVVSGYTKQLVRKAQQVLSAKNLIRRYSRATDNVSNLKDTHAQSHEVKAQLLIAETNFQFQEALWGLIYTFSILTISAFAVFNGTLTLGEYIGIQIYVGIIRSPIGILLKQYKSFVKDREVLLKFQQQEATSKKLQIIPDKRFQLAAVLRTTHLKYRHLQSITFSIKHGERVLFAAPKGEDISDIARLLSGEIHPDVGTILVGQHDLKSIPTQMSRHWSSTIQKTPQLFHGSLEDNLFLGAPSNKVRAYKILKAVGLDSFANPDGLLLSLDPGKLSLEVQHRLQIARALLIQPEVLIIEDFTDGLLHKTADDLFSLIRAHQKTLILIGSNEKLLELANQVYWIKDGYTHQVQSVEDFFFDPDRTKLLSGPRFQKSLHQQGALIQATHWAIRNKQTLCAWNLEFFGKNSNQCESFSQLITFVSEELQNNFRKSDIIFKVSSTNLYCAFQLKELVEKNEVALKLSKAIVKILKDLREPHVYFKIHENLEVFKFYEKVTTNDNQTLNALNVKCQEDAA